MTRVTRAQVEALVQPGDFVVISYMRPDFVQAEIARVTGEPWMHAARCVGGLETVEADIVGVTVGSLRNYLRGNCRVLLRRAKPAHDEVARQRVVDAALGMVGEKYDFGMIVGMAGLFLIRRLLRPVAPRLGDWCLGHLKNLFADRTKTTCAELVAVTERVARPSVLRPWPAENVTPGLLTRGSDFVTVADWRAPVLVRGGSR